LEKEVAKKRFEKFGEMLTEAIRIIKACEKKKKIATIERELGNGLGYRGGSAVERWRQGHLPPTIAKREKLARLIFERTCGRLDRAWFEEFLRQADHPYPDPILDELFRLPFFAPPLPKPALVGRDQLLLNLKRRLFAGDSVALFALNGLPGVGKSALAITLAHDEEMRAHFPGGVLWAELGREPDLLALLNVWGLALRIPASEMAKLATIEERARVIHATIGTRRLLLVIDDAWQIEAALAFKLGGPNCAHLLTTRVPDLALDFAGRGARPVQELNESDSLALLAELVSDLVIKQPEEARALVKAVGGLPLALILMGRYIQNAVDLGQEHVLSDLLTQLQHATARLGLTVAQSPLEKQPSLPFGIPLSLLASIEISDKALDEPARQLLQALSLFPPNKS